MYYYFSYCLPLFIYDVFCFLKNVIMHPLAAINQFIILIEDVIFLLLPATPDNLKLSALFSGLAALFPNFGWGIFAEIFKAFAIAFGIWIIWRIYRALPIIGGGG